MLLAQFLGLASGVVSVLLAPRGSGKKPSPLEARPASVVDGAKLLEMTAGRGVIPAEVHSWDEVGAGSVAVAASVDIG